MSLGPEHVVHPEWLPAVFSLWLAAALAVGLARLQARRRRQRLGPAVRPGLSLARDVALLLALAGIGVALLGPRLGEKVVTLGASGVDVALLLDVSRSMDAADVPPSRLDRARRGAEEVLARLGPRDRAALAVFASRGVLLAPLTPDRDALVELLVAVDTQLVTPAGSDLAAGVRAALGAFEVGSQRPRVVLVLSDGEDPMQRGELGIGDLLAAEARVVAVAIGSEAGAFVPDADLPLLDPRGEPVVTRRRADRLERLAAATDGALLRADTWGSFDARAAVRSIRRDAGLEPGEPLRRRTRAVQVLPLAVLAFALLLLEGLPPPSRRPRRALAAGLALSVGWLVGAGPAAPGTDTGALEARLRARPGDARLLLELGLARLERGRHAGAERAFLAAAIRAREPHLAATAYYDLGVAALERGDYPAARDAFFDALALAPHDRQARFNLEWAQKALPKHSASPPPPEPDERAAPAPEPPPAPDTERDEPTTTHELGAAERERWLRRVRDDPNHALRSVAGGESARRGRELAW